MFEVERPAVVLGSLQSVDVVDEAACAAAGVEIARRRSGGGVVLLEPGRIVWFDVIVPAELLRAVGVGDDVRSSMIWLGDLIAAAAGELGIDRVDVHRGPPVGSRDICFAGIGPGEVDARRAQAGRGEPTQDAGRVEVPVRRTHAVVARGAGSACADTRRGAAVRSDARRGARSAAPRRAGEHASQLAPRIWAQFFSTVAKKRAQIGGREGTRPDFGGAGGRCLTVRGLEGQSGDRWGSVPGPQRGSRPGRE